jgi:twinkle protein
MTKSKLLKSHQPCLNPTCGSSDALSIYDDGHSFCFSCGTLFPSSSGSVLPRENDSPSASLPDDSSWTYEYLPWRGITSETMRAFDVKTKIDASGKPQFLGFPYGENALIIRSLSEKKFFTKGSIKDATLFGKDKFSPGSSKACTITEGAIDALSVYQMLGSKYPVFSVRSATSAKSDCAKEQEYLNSFERIYLCLDNDDPGRKASKEIAELFDFNKVYNVALSKKDANEYLQAGEQKQFVNSWHAAKKYVPEGIISTFQEFDLAIDQKHSDPIGMYPWDSLNAMTLGIRPKEIVLIKAFEKVGKTEFLSSIEYHNLIKSNVNLGVIHIEEGKDRVLKRLAGYDLNIPAHLPDSNVTPEDIKSAYRRAIRSEDRLHIYSHFGSSDPNIILDIIRFMVTVLDCRIVFLDHITMAVSGLELDDERRTLDILSTRMATMVNELNFALCIISHINDDGKTRGSRNIAKVANIILSLERDITHPDPIRRNTTHVVIEGNRFSGATGPACNLFFDQSTWTLSELTPLEAKIPVEV